MAIGADKSRADFKQSILSRYDAEYMLVDDIWDCLSTQEKLAQYLPRRGGGQNIESSESYLLRLQTTSLPRAFRDGLERGIGRFGLANFQEDTPKPIQDLEKNIDGLGCNLDSFVFRVLANLLKYGSLALMVDIVEEQLRVTIVPVTSLMNRSIIGGKVASLTVEHVDEIPDGHDTIEQKKYLEYMGDRLWEWTKDPKGDTLALTNEIPLTNAAGEPRGEVYTVWLSCDPNAPKWKPCPPPFVNLAKKSILQMHKSSELDRAETICNMQVLKRYHPQGIDPTAVHPDIEWDPECVVEIPFGGDVKVDEPRGTAIATTHERNKDRQAEMDRTVDTWLMEKVRTATESAIADNAEKTRLEILTKAVQQAMEQVFRYMMLLADRRFNPDKDEVGGITLSSTAYSQVTDEEISMATDDFSAQAIPLKAVRRIKEQQWLSRGYLFEEGDWDEDDTFPGSDILNGRTQAQVSTLS